MKLYFYSSSNAVRDMLSLNMLGCYALFQKERAKTIGYISNTNLFLTHKKVNAEKLNYGLDSDIAFGESPIVVEITITDDIAKKISVVLVNSSGKKLVTKSGKLKDYDMNKSVGAFWKGFIPMSYVTGIYFENREAMLDFYRPSPDLWYPECLYKILDETEFIDDLDVEKIASLNREDDAKEISEVATRYIKERAILYYLINATSKWQYGKHILNIDPVLVQLFNIDVSAVKDLTGEEFENLIPLSGEDVLAFDKESGLYKLYEAILDELLKTNVTTVFDEVKFDEISNAIYSKLEEQGVKEKFIADCKMAANIIKGGVLSSNDEYEKSLEKLNHASPYAALALVMKNPHYDDNFMASFEAYSVTQDVARIAQIFFAAINGLNFLNGDYKNNLYLNRQVEEIAIAQVNCEGIPNVVYSEKNYEELFSGEEYSELKKFEITYNMTITEEEIRLFFISPEGKNLIKLPAIQKAYGKKKICDWTKYKYFLVPSDAKKGDRISVEEIEKFLKSAKGSSFYKYDVDMFCVDMIENQEAFSKLYNTKPDLWKELYKNRKR